MQWMTVQHLAELADVLNIHPASLWDALHRPHQQ